MYSTAISRLNHDQKPRRQGAAGFLAMVTLAAASAFGGEESARAPISLPTDLVTAIDPGPPKTVDQLRLLQEQVRRVVVAARPVTVAVELDDSVGSGVIVSGEGLVLTAGHVCVEPNRELTIRFPDGRQVVGRSLGVNHPLDSGLAQITEEPTNADGEPLKAWPHVPLAKEKATVGDWVIGLGQPNGFVSGRSPPVRLGRVLSIDKEAINTDVTLVGGDSGGPLLNLQAEVVGIHSKIGEQITSNYHVPVDLYRANWERLTSGRMTGVPDGEDPDDWRPMLGLAVRVVGNKLVVSQVFPGQAAEGAGVRVGDVLKSLAGEPLVAAPQAVERAVQRLEPFERVRLLVRRNGTDAELELWLGRGSVDFPGTLSAREGR